jgi:transposase
VRIDKTTVDWDTLAACPTLGLDEIALLKGHSDFGALITARDTADELHVVAVLPDRLKTTILTWLTALPAAVRARITTVCTDIMIREFRTASSGGAVVRWTHDITSTDHHERAGQ